MEKYYDAEKNPIEIIKKVGGGGEGTIYSLKNGDILKIFKDPSSGHKQKKIELFLAKKLNFEGICFPKMMVFDQKGKFAGYTMPKAQGREIAKSVFLPMPLTKTIFPNWKRKELCSVALDILKKIRYLHSKNIIIGDLNGSNILVTEDLKVFFVDTDSYQIDEYPCPVGKPHFTAPEIQGKNFAKFLRTTDHELFAISILLFMILLPGKAPYTYRGGGSVTENIRAKNFPYPLGDEDNQQVPRGVWEFIWYELPFDLRTLFYETFRNGKQIEIEDWINEFYLYEESLSKTLKDIIPSEDFRNEFTGTISMGGGLNPEKNPALRKIKTALAANEDKYAVIELSTKAVKFLFARDIDKLRIPEFYFDNFYRKGIKTETGQGLNHKNEMNLNFFRQRVIPVIKTMKKEAEDQKIGAIYSVATAAYRTAKNRDKILDLIRTECGLNVQILTKKEEAIATTTAFMFSKPKSIASRYSSANNILMIDQGGGSTEIILSDKNTDIKGIYSLNLGTTVLKTVLFREANRNTTLNESLQNATRLIKRRLYTFKNSKNSDFLRENQLDLVLSVGTAITNATGKIGNKRQHGTILTLNMLKDRIAKTDHALRLQYTFTSQLDKDMQNADKSSKLDNIVVMRLGLVMFVEIMQQFGIEELIVSGTGLWYGIYFQQLFNLN